MKKQMKGPFQLISSETKYKNDWIQVREDRVIRPGGDTGIFGVVKMVPGSSVLTLDRDNNVYLVIEYKYGVERETLEVMSGCIDQGELPIDAAKRELKEELGLKALQWDYLGVVDPFTTVVACPNHMFLARSLSHVSQSTDSGEELRIVKIPFSQALEKVIAGDITHATSCVLILKADRLLTK